MFGRFLCSGGFCVWAAFARGDRFRAGGSFSRVRAVFVGSDPFRAGRPLLCVRAAFTCSDRFRAGGRRISADEQAADLVDEEGHDPGDEQLEHDGKDRPAPAFGFLLDGRDGRGAGDVEQAEDHQAQRVEGAEPAGQGAQRFREARHALGRARVDDAEEHRAAGDDHFLRGDARDQRDDDLPEAEPDRSKGAPR